MTNPTQSSCYVACVPHVPLLKMQAKESNSKLWESYDARVAEFEAFDPELVIVFGGNHYQGVFLNLSPTFIVGQIAEAVDDCGGVPGKLNIPLDLSIALAADLVNQGIDVATSYAMTVDHGFTNVLGNFMGGKIDARPVIPVHINSMTFPRATMKRCRELGEAVGRWASTLGKRVAILGSGGLSHQTDFIFPQYDTAPNDDVRQFIVHGTGAIGLQKWMDDIQSGMDQLSGDILDGSFHVPWINAEWDKRFLQTLDAGDLTAFDGWQDEEILENGGYGGGEIRMWVAAAAAGQAAGAGQVKSDYYSDEDPIAVGAAVAHSALPRG